MILLYSGADSPDIPQINPEKSLGGFVSSSPVPNGRLSNIFSLVSKNTVLKNKKEIRLIVLKNTTGVIVNNINIYTDVTGSSIKLKIAAVSPATNACSQKVFETVLDGDTLPYQATLAEQEGVLDPIIVASLAVDGLIGIWIYREIDLTKFPELNQAGAVTPLTCTEMAELLEAQAASTEEEVKLIISYS